jgi:hypothetical protein
VEGEGPLPLSENTMVQVCWAIPACADVCMTSTPAWPSGSVCSSLVSQPLQGWRDQSSAQLPARGYLASD